MDGLAVFLIGCMVFSLISGPLTAGLKRMGRAWVKSQQEIEEQTRRMMGQ